MLVLSSLLVDPWIKMVNVTFENEKRAVEPFSVCPSVDSWIQETQPSLIPAITITFIVSQTLILRNAATRTTMTRNLPIYEMVMAVTFTSAITF